MYHTAGMPITTNENQMRLQFAKSAPTWHNNNWRSNNWGTYLGLDFRVDKSWSVWNIHMGSYGKITSSIPGFYSVPLELNNVKCVICSVEEEPVVQTTCGHRFCTDYMMRYDFKWANCIRIFKVQNIELFTKFRFQLFFIFLLYFWCMRIVTYCRLRTHLQNLNSVPTAVSLIRSTE